MTTRIGYFIGQCREVQQKRDSADSYFEREYWARVMDTAVEDLRIVRGWHRKDARKRLKRMKRKGLKIG